MEIVITKENMCTCSCVDKCILGRIGSQARCTKKELEDIGYKTRIVAASKEKTSVWNKAFTIIACMFIIFEALFTAYLAGNSKNAKMLYKQPEAIIKWRDTCVFKNNIYKP